MTKLTPQTTKQKLTKANVSPRGVSSERKATSSINLLNPDNIILI